MNLRKNTIDLMLEYHKSFKNDEVSNLRQKISDSINQLSASDRNFMLLTGKMDNVKAVYPVSDQLTTQYLLADLVMAYHLYLQEINSNKDNIALMDRIDRFYHINHL